MKLLSDIAQAAGVSTSTAVRAIKRGDIAAERIAFNGRELWQIEQPEAAIAYLLTRAGNRVSVTKQGKPRKWTRSRRLALIKAAHMRFMSRQPICMEVMK